VVFITEGMSVRIPQGGLQVSFDDDGNLNVSAALHVVYEVWPLWLEIALDNAELACRIRERLTRVANEEQKGKLLVKECKLAMVGVTASVTALDAFFACVCERLPAYQALRSKWSGQTKRPGRAGQVSQVFHQSFRYQPAVYDRLKAALKELYAIRGVAVHPPAGFQSPVQHEALGVGVEWRFATFTSTNALKAASLVTDIIHHSVGVSRTSLPELSEWCATARPKVDPIQRRSSRLRGKLPDK
jgi:hypothetical protein